MSSAQTDLGSVQFGRYRIVERLGEGGMGVVFRAVIEGPRGFQRSCVIKRLQPLLSRDEGFVKSLIAEARVSALLHHPSIVQVQELGEINGEYYLVMEYVEGPSLTALLNRCRMIDCEIPQGIACFIISELAHALSYAHALVDEEGRPLGIVHRDVSPSNVIVTPMGTVKLLDFGVAKAADHVLNETTRSGALKGKVGYMSPEQAEGLAVDHRSDIFALGIILHEMLTLERLFKRDTEMSTLRAVRTGEVRPLREGRPDVDPEVESAVMKMLARDPNERFPSADAVATALAPIVHRLGTDRAALRGLIKAVGPIPRQDPPRSLDGMGGDTLSVEVVLDRNPQPEAEAEPPPPRPLPRWRLWVAAALTLLAVVGIEAWRHRRARAHTMVAAALTPRVEPTPQYQAKPPSQPAATRSSVHLSVTAIAGAEVSVDGKTAGRVPLELDLPSAAGARTIEVHRHGYVTFSTRVAGDGDATLAVTLKSKRGRHSEASAPALMDPFRR
jgi:serine/threonine-protein kinase